MATIEAGASPADAAKLAENEAIRTALAQEGADSVAIARAVASNQPILEPRTVSAYFDDIRTDATTKTNAQGQPNVRQRLHMR